MSKTIEERVSELEEKLSKGFVIKSPNGRHTITLIVNDDTCGLWVEDHISKTRAQLVAMGEIGQTYVGVATDVTGKHKYGDAAAISVDPATGEGTIQLVDDKLNIVTLSAKDIEQLRSHINKVEIDYPKEPYFS